jgi:flagellar protein FlbD
MIQLTRLNNRPLIVNSDLIKFIEKAPDTVLTLVTGEKIVVRESPEEVMKQIVDYRRRVLSPYIRAREEGSRAEENGEPEGS